MHLIRMIYASTRVQDHDLDLNELSQVAHSNNKPNNLSGMLAFDRKYFIQAIEGERKLVCKLLGKLYADPRHTELVLLEFDPIEQRNFGQWSMQFVPLDSSTKDIIFKYSTDQLFNPYAFSKSSALSFLMDLRPAQ